MAQVIHWKLFQKFGLPYKEMWYDHSPDSVTENDIENVLCDFKIQTDQHLYRKRPHITVHKKSPRECVYVACLRHTSCRKEEKS